MHIASLHLHPLKSCAQLDVDMLDITPRGPAGDRRWLIVDDAGRFITARQRAEVVGIRAVPDAAGLRLDAPGMPTLHVAVPAGDAARTTVTIWKDSVHAQRCDPAAHVWLTRDPDGEPLRTLARYRRTPAGVTFGMNLIPRGTGPVRRGDAVTVLA